MRNMSDVRMTEESSKGNKELLSKYNKDLLILCETYTLSELMISVTM